MKLAKELAKQAAKLGACPEGYSGLKNLSDKKGLIEMYLSNLEFCLSHDFPDNAFIRKHFSGLMEDYGIFLDDAIALSNPSKCIALGQTTGSIILDGYAAAEIFVKHTARLNIVAKDKAFAMIDVFDQAEVVCEVYGAAKVVINKYGAATVSAKQYDAGLLKITDKRKNTY